MERRDRDLGQGLDRDQRRGRRQGRRPAEDGRRRAALQGRGRGREPGCTQRGRIEYALGGGRINTDAIDNVAGVNCSDHEVNIKILLGEVIARNELDPAARNRLLAELTEAVGSSVIYASRIQTQAISLSVVQAPSMLDVHARLISALESAGALRRRLEFLPEPDEIGAGGGEGGLTAPEVAVVMAYVKIFLYARLLESNLPEDEHLADELGHYFPDPLPERFPQAMPATACGGRSSRPPWRIAGRPGRVNVRIPVDRGDRSAGAAAGPGLRRGPGHLRDATVLAGDRGPRWLDRAPRCSCGMLIEGRRLVERAARWLLQANPRSIDVQGCHERYRSGAAAIWDALPEPLGEEERERLSPAARSSPRLGCRSSWRGGWRRCRCSR